MNALFDKIFFRLRIIYDNFLKSSKTLKKIKVYFIYINNYHKITQKTCEKEKTPKIDRTICFYTLKQFVSFFFNRFIRVNFLFLFVISIIIVNKKILTKMFVSIVINKIILQ